MKKTDSELKKDVLNELKWDPSVSSNDIGVIVNDSVVTLTGSVEHYTEKMAAEQAVLRVSGVDAEANDIEIKLSTIHEHTDTDIAQAASNALEWHVSVPSNILAVVKDGWITLKGEVEWHYQRRAAKTAVENLAGVKGVLNQITIKTRVSTADVKEKIEVALKRNAVLEAHSLQVETSGDKVTLRGRVHTWTERYEAGHAA